MSRSTYALWPSLALRRPRVQAQALSALVVAFLYAALAGFGMPTVRTVLMIAAVALTKCSRRAFSPVHALALALIAILSSIPLPFLKRDFGFLSWASDFWCCALKRKGAAFVRSCAT
jgi:competence protein ComEC